MPISFTCPHCGHQTQVADEYAGQSGPCAGCGREVTVTGGGRPGAPPRPKGNSSTVVLIVVLVGVVGMCGLGLLVAIALLLPAVQSARGAARRASCGNNLHQIGLALHSYHDEYDVFPPAYTVDDEGRPLHSWRVLILPYLEQQGLYSQIDLNKPWDAPENAALASQMPSVYACPSSPESPLGGTTHYVVIVGDEAVFQPGGARRLSQMTNADGAMNTILVVESTDAVGWMEPEDLRFDEMNFAIDDPAGTSIGSHHPGGANVLFGDVSVQFLTEDQYPADSVRALITADGGEPGSRAY